MRASASTQNPKAVDRPAKLISGSIAALLAGGASTASGQVTLGGAGFTVENDQSVAWDVDGNGSADFSIAAYDAYNTGPQSITRLDIAASSGPESALMRTAGGKFSPFGTSVLVSSGKAFDNTETVTDGGSLVTGAIGFTDGGRGYIGFSFDISGNTHYGWADVTTNFAPNNSWVVHQWAWNATAGAAIQIGDTGASAVPEPAAAATGLGLLALGAAGLRRQRWLKRKAA